MLRIAKHLRTFCPLWFAYCLAVSSAADRNPIPPDHAERMSRGLMQFQQRVRPLLQEHCVKCHGGEKTKGEFDLTTREGLLQGGAEGLAVTLYDSRASRLYQLITHAKDPHMPSKGEKLPNDAIDQIAAWIDNGAPYDQPLVDGKVGVTNAPGGISESDRNWWSFRPLQHAEPPKTKATEWTLTPVDAFILARLEDQGLKPSSRADRRTLIRRASMDLLGIPPTPEEVAAFSLDAAPDAWPRVVARLLDSPHFGERWARHWLDVARFAESSGFEHDTDRPNAYHYRDFVIQALNANQPYDQFVRWQIAGDEFEPDSPMALKATGFLGAGVFPTQITANEVERTRYDSMDDMLATTGTAFLGLTIGCARCHDHKFDPIPTRDYYRLLSTFTTTVRSDIDLDLQPEENHRAREAFESEHFPLVAAEKAYEEKELPQKFDAWIAAGALLPKPTWELISVSNVSSLAGATFRPLDDGSLLVEGENADSDVYLFTADVSTPEIRALRIEAMAHPSLPKGGPGRADNGNIGLSRIHIYSSPLGGGETNEVRLSQARASFEQNTNSLSIASALDQDPKTGWAVDPQFGTNHVAIFLFEKPLNTPSGVRLTIRLEFELNTRHNIGRPRLAVSTAENPSFGGNAVPANLAKILQPLQTDSRAAASLPKNDRLALMNWWKSTDPGWQSLHARVEAHAREAPKLKLTKVLVCAEGYPALRMNTQGADFFGETYFLHRGSTDLKRDVVKPGFLQVLLRDPEQESHWRWTPPQGSRFSGRRRSLANWMTDTDRGAGHLLARVMVNRLWQHLFGQGLVATPNDFGAQGVKPTHPELLDWLAAKLIRDGWRLKPILQLLMTSAVYQQGAQTEVTHQNATAGNPLHAGRVPRRLEAESIRDSLLFVSGMLDSSLGGPGTLDPSSHRRSIYFTVKRSQLIPAMQAFDAPEPLVSQGTRPTTTVAPQALWLMNSSQVRAWATAFARRFGLDPDEPPTEVISRAYNLALNRRPTTRELFDAADFIEQQMKRHNASDRATAREEALTDFAQVLLSLNEFIYVE